MELSQRLMTGISYHDGGVTACQNLKGKAYDDMKMTVHRRYWG
jgi:hypothetical protein